MRNMEKTAETIKGKFTAVSGLDKYDMTSSEMNRLIEMIKKGETFDAISTAFEYGFVLGHRATVAGKI